VVVLGLGLIALALVLEPLVITKSVPLTLIILAFQGIFTGTVPTAIYTMVTSATGSKERGVVTSLYGSVRFFGVAMGPPLFSLAMTHRYVVFWAVAALTCGTALLSFFAINERKLLPRGMRGPNRTRRPRQKLT
jgi:ACDE family multidrug resistance protein